MARRACNSSIQEDLELRFIMSSKLAWAGQILYQKRGVWQMAPIVRNAY